MPRRFALALEDPFNTAAKGAQVPDMYTFPTSTLCLEGEFMVVPDTNGNFDIGIYPDPTACVFTSQCRYLASTVASGPVGGIGLGPTSTILNCAPQMQGIISANNLASLSSQYRVVGVGIKMETLMIPTAATGSLTVCQLPCPDFGLDKQMMAQWRSGPYAAPAQGTNDAGPLNVGATAYGYNINSGTPAAAGIANAWAPTCFYSQPALDSSGYFDPSMRVYPTGYSMNGAEFQAHGIQSTLRPCGPTTFQWKNPISSDVMYTSDNAVVQPSTNVAYSAGQTYVTNGTTGGVATTSCNKLDGWSALYIRGAGFPQTSAGPFTAVATLRVIFHIEYAEKITALGSAGRFPPVATGQLVKILDKTSSLPFYRHVTQNMSQMQKAFTRLGV